MKHAELPGGEHVPALGQGTWHMGDRRREREREVAAMRAGVRAACEASLERLGTDRIDLYLLHWRGGADLADETAFPVLPNGIWGRSNECIGLLNQFLLWPEWHTLNSKCHSTLSRMALT